MFLGPCDFAKMHHQQRMAALGTDKELSDLLDFSAVRNSHFPLPIVNVNVENSFMKEINASFRFHTTTTVYINVLELTEPTNFSLLSNICTELGCFCRVTCKKRKKNQCILLVLYFLLMCVFMCRLL